MSSFKHQSPEGNDLPRRSRSYDLWYYERRSDDRLYFRLAPLGWILLVIPAILAVGAIAILFLYNTGTPLPEPRTTIKPPDVSSDPPTKSVIKPAPPLSPPPQVPSRSNFNSIKPIPSPQPTRSPNGQ